MSRLRFLNAAVIRDTRGFTLTEMLIVMALIALLGTVVTTSLVGKYQKSQVDAAKIQMKQLTTILEQFHLDCSRYPSTEEGMDALVEKPPSLDCSRYDPQGYIANKKVPKDPWGKDFVFTSDTKVFEIISYGSDKVEGGEDYGADISSKNLD